MTAKAQLQAYLATLEQGQHFTLADVQASGFVVKHLNATLNKCATNGQLVRKVARPQDHKGELRNKGCATWAKL